MMKNNQRFGTIKPVGDIAKELLNQIEIMITVIKNKRKFKVIKKGSYYFGKILPLYEIGELYFLETNSAILGFEESDVEEVKKTT